MPLIQVDLPRPLFEQIGSQVSAEIHRALIEALEIPADDKFQVFRPREVGELVFDPSYGGVDRRNLILTITRTGTQGACPASENSQAFLALIPGQVH